MPGFECPAPNARFGNSQKGAVKKDGSGRRTLRREAPPRPGPVPALRCALLLLALASSLGGLVDDPGTIIAARAVQGLAGALLYPAVLPLVTTLFEPGMSLLEESRPGMVPE